MYQGTIALNNDLTLKTTVTDGGFVRFVSDVANLATPLASPDNTSLNPLSVDDDVLLHILFRRALNKIVLNTRASTSRWGAEQVISLADVFTATRAPTTITIDVRSDTYELLYNEGEKHSFTKRMAKDVAAVRYRANGAFTLFSDSISVEYAP